jgi:Cu-Zn family superoxide dismutase
VHVNVKVSGLAPGLHGAHIHTIGSCTDANGVAFGGAGGHFNPHGAPHGEHSRTEHADHHAGDLPNLVANADGQGRLNTASAHFTLSHDVAESLFDANGSAIVVHANEDDYVTQTGPLGPGQSGPRIACGVIEES